MSLRLFEGIGVELEYMIVDRETLAVRPIADRLLSAVSPSGGPESEVELGPISWSNELAAHVVELKTTSPAPSPSGLYGPFREHVRRIDAILEPMGARLMPTAMHPLMDPAAEARLWPHDYGPVYETFDRIFDCRGHGWSNLQSMHLNLPFSGDEEFGRLHAAIRLILPILPALAASSPIVEGKVTGLLDNRLEFYRHNCRRVPEVTGRVIPEPAFTRAEYDRLILEPMYAAIAPLDPDGVLRHEWLNARGAIARFDRSAIEIRLLDVQECPSADLAIASLVVASVRALVEERWSSTGDQRALPVDVLEPILLSCVGGSGLSASERSVVADPAYLRCFGLDARGPRPALDLWRHLFHALRDELGPEVDRSPLPLILDRGPLARRILGRLGADGPVTPSEIRSVYADLCDCLVDDRPFG
ncbi:carboxylate-amine ligase [Tautonia plasticadhaerens]|uniref:Carboxylate-amine ligase YbdK n=1 Tax=Tautonia plasticadhaerens TaxID=2527974 RepID=A0A518HCR7_9BACT|nr:glutamate-cysteine ligase family protein [Tautonia plasticadhaerens]QDV38613.1 Carboxylate-amine ligase YbdK [Tautonia plasticadhaerens]